MNSRDVTANSVDESSDAAQLDDQDTMKIGYIMRSVGRLLLSLDINMTLQTTNWRTEHGRIDDQVSSPEDLMNFPRQYIR